MKLDSSVGNGVLQLLGLGVDGAPIHFKHVDQECLHQAVPAQHAEREPATGGGQPYAAPGRMDDQAVGGEGLDHGRDRAGHHGERLGQRAHGDESAVAGREQQDPLQVVFDRDAGHGGPSEPRGLTMARIHFD